MAAVTPHVFQIGSFSHKKWLSKNFRNRQFCREKHSLSFKTFRVPNRQIMTEKIAKYKQD
jgi:hypothetical protein